MAKIRKTEGKVKIEGVSFDIAAMQNARPKVLKGSLVDNYFSHLPESKQQAAADTLWAEIAGKDAPDSAADLSVEHT